MWKKFRNRDNGPAEMQADYVAHGAIHNENAIGRGESAPTL